MGRFDGLSRFPLEDLDDGAVLRLHHYRLSVSDEPFASERAEAGLTRCSRNRRGPRAMNFNG